MRSLEPFVIVVLALSACLGASDAKAGQQSDDAREGLQSSLERASGIDWNAVLDRGEVSDVYVDRTAKFTVTLVMPVKPPLAHRGGPKFTVDVLGHRFWINALTLDPPLFRWGTSLKIRDIVRGTEVDVVVPTGTWIGHVSWSPKGNWISYVVREDTGHYLWVASVGDGKSHRVSKSPVNLLVWGQATTSMRYGFGQVPYTWLSDESHIVFATKDESIRMNGAEWSRVNPPIWGDSRNAADSYPTSRVMGNKSETRKTKIEKAYSQELIVAPVERNNAEKTVKLAHGITHLLTRPYLSQVSAVTISVSADGEYRRSAQAVTVSPTLRVHDPAPMPRSAGWRLYSSASADDIAIIHSQSSGSNCLIGLAFGGANMNQLCFENEIISLVENATDLVVLHDDGVVTVVSKTDMRSRGAVATGLRDSDAMFLLHPVSFWCDESWVPTAASGRVHYTGSRLSSFSVTRIQRDDTGALEISKGPGLQADSTRPTNLATCGGSAMVSRQSWLTPRNYLLLSGESDASQFLTNFNDVMPEFIAWERIELSYERSDGVPLSAQIILPPQVTRRVDGKFPAVVWQYPINVQGIEEWDRFQADGRSPSGSYRTQEDKLDYSRPLIDDYIGRWLPNLLALDGYAIISYPDFPLVGVDGNSDFGSYSEQLRANADALVNAIRETGVVDEMRIAIGGHSRGGAIAALLLAETDHFAAGFSYAGPSSFNSHLNGFQYENRSYWDYPEAYLRNGSIFNADRIDEPLLSMYGELDNLPTREQGQDLHSVLTKIGGISRLVVYPDEIHNPMYRETQLEILEEVSTWLDEYLVVEKPRGTLSEPWEGVPIDEVVELEQFTIH